MVARRVVRRAGTPASRCLDECLAHIAGPHRLPRVLPASQDTEHPLADVQERPLPEATRDPLAPGAPREFQPGRAAYPQGIQRRRPEREPERVASRPGTPGEESVKFSLQAHPSGLGRAAGRRGRRRNAPGWNRTSDPLLRRQVLYPLSYEGGPIVSRCDGALPRRKEGG